MAKQHARTLQSDSPFLAFLVNREKVSEGLIFKSGKPKPQKPEQEIVSRSKRHLSTGYAIDLAGHIGCKRAGQKNKHWCQLRRLGSSSEQGITPKFFDLFSWEGRRN